MYKLTIDDNNYIIFTDNGFETLYGNKAHTMYHTLSFIAREIITRKNITYTAELEQFTIAQLLKEVNKIGVN